MPRLFVCGEPLDVDGDCGGYKSAMGLGERAARGETWQMILVRNLRLAPSARLMRRAVRPQKLRIPEREIKELKLVKRSLDARKKSDIHYVCGVAAALHGDEQKAIAHAKSADVSEYAEPVYDIPHVAAPEKRPVIVGFGPRACLRRLCWQRPERGRSLLERGMDAVSRKKAGGRARAGGEPQPESNVQFGEGGAGTFSDGKLNTGTKDRRMGWMSARVCRARRAGERHLRREASYRHGYSDRRRAEHPPRGHCPRRRGALRAPAGATELRVRAAHRRGRPLRGE